MADEIIQELWEIKEKIAREHDFNIDDLAAALREREARSKSRVVDLSARRDETDQ